MEVTKAMLENVPNPEERKSPAEEFTDSPNDMNGSTVLLITTPAPLFHFG